jgi:hypothetical protein
VRVLLIIPFCLLAAACGMAGPGIGGGPNTGPGPTWFNNSWVTNQELEPNQLNENPQLSVDISERQLGVPAWFENDGDISKRRQPGYVQRQQERQAERRAIMRERMGLSNIRQEQQEREKE